MDFHELLVVWSCPPDEDEEEEDDPTVDDDENEHSYGSRQLARKVPQRL